MDAVYARQVDLGGRKLTAEFARSKYDQTSGRNPPTDTIYVGSLPYTATEADLRQVFEPFGPLVRISIGMYLNFVLQASHLTRVIHSIQ